MINLYVNSGEELIKICDKNKLSIWEYTLQCESENSGKSKQELMDKMKENLNIMKESSEMGLNKKVMSVSGLIGGDAFKLNQYMKDKETLCGDFMVKVMARALSSAEVNASMGRIVAAPTAGSCGILPSVVLTTGERYEKSEDDLIKALFTAAGVGIIIGNNASISGAEGGCQAECGTASAMAAAAVIEMLGGTPKMALNGASIVIKNLLGLICDPIAGLVEIPCAKRNVGGAVLALHAVDLSLAGIESKIPLDEVVNSMYRVGRMLPSTLKETALGGLAITKTGLKMKDKIFNKKKP
jgi:L-serine dehydratase